MDKRYEILKGYETKLLGQGMVGKSLDIHYGYDQETEQVKMIKLEIEALIKLGCLKEITNEQKK